MPNSVLSACHLDCPDRCSFFVETNDEGDISLRGNPDHPITKGFLCPKSRKFPTRIDREDRILTPLLRDGDSFKPVSWDTALDLCASHINRLRETPEKILHLRGYGYSGVLGKASSLFFKALGATKTRGSLCDGTGEAAFIEDFGSMRQNKITDLRYAKVIVNWGKDPLRSSVHTAQLISKARKKGAFVISIAPETSAMQSFSDHVLLIKPGSDRYLATAVLAILHRRGHLPEVDEVADTLDGYKELLEYLDMVSVPSLLEKCGIALAGAETLAYAYTHGPTASLIGWGCQRHIYGGENVRMINALAAITGNMGIHGGGTYYANLSSASAFEPWGVQTEKQVPVSQTISLPLLAQEVKEQGDRFEMVWIDGMNPANQVGAAGDVKSFLARTPFVVAVDAFMNDSVQQADLILPCALMYEREEVIGSCMHHVINYCQKAVEPRGEARDDFSILTELGGRLDSPVLFPTAEECLQQALSRYPEALPVMKIKGFFEEPVDDVAYEDGFDHPDGKCRLFVGISDEPENDGTYPYTLLTLVSRKAIHTQQVEEHTELPTVTVSMMNPIIKELSDSGQAKLVTERGSMTVIVQGDAAVQQDVVVIRRGGWVSAGQCANDIITPLLTDMGEGAAFYSQKVNLVAV
ncbi:MAG: molybdopterin-dependent oxidoreductase [Desulfovibrio sp.]